MCEGEKTEPNYFEELTDHYGLSSANVEICGHCGSDPVSVFHYGKQRYREERDAGDPFDRVFCVFDRDNHTNYDQAVNTICQATPKDTFYAITSVPCFEYWLLLHFQYTTRAYVVLPGNSACHQVLSALKAFLPHYTKGENRIFSSLLQQLDFAKNNAARAFQAAQDNHTDNPTTRVHELVDVLQNIKKNR